ncbi:MAG: c-type cytochrome [Leptospirillia bacterium]
MIFLMVFLMALLPAPVAGEEGHLLSGVETAPAPLLAQVAPTAETPAAGEAAPEAPAAEEAAPETPAAEEAAPETPPVERDKADWSGVANPIAADKKSIARGMALYMGSGRCQVCHGKEGDGLGPVFTQFSPRPNAFFSDDWHDKYSDGNLMQFLMDGKPGTGMVSIIPDFLTEEEGWDVINYIRTLRGKTTEGYEKFLAGQKGAIQTGKRELPTAGSKKAAQPGVAQPGTAQPEATPAQNNESVGE